jgi:hypothetical protein
MKTVENENAQLARVDVAGDRVDAEPEQQWVVLSAWEEVRTVTRTSSTITDYYAGTATADAAADGAAQTQQRDGKSAENATNRLPTQTSSQYTIRQLILRVAPANSNSNSTQPAMSVRGGWFVIQL